MDQPQKPVYLDYIMVPRYTCQRCAHKWLSLRELVSPGTEPIQCPACHSPYWRTTSTRPKNPIPEKQP